jgi:glycosyltransferase involved in cell wall biosynthesis
MKKLLVIGRTFPEPSTTAAGGRMLDLLQFFLENEYQIVFASAASLSERSAPLKTLGIEVKNVQLNDDSFDVCLEEFQADIVLFDRFISEEQFGWRVSEILPKALKILDTEDLHFLRKAREAAHNTKVLFEEDQLYSDEAKRELASILRCDLSLIISEYEMDLLQRLFKIPSEILYYLPLLVAEKLAAQKKPSFEERQYFITAGNFYHAPNLDAVLRLKKEIWPLIRKESPQAELHIYGAYAPEQVLQMHKPKEGFFIEGWIADLDIVLSQAKVCLAPLSFGAGLKGKLVQAMINQTPVVTTKIGAEGMYGKGKVPGIIAEDSESIAQAAITLYNQKETWEACQIEINSILSNRFNKAKYLREFAARLTALENNLETHRKANFIMQIMQHETLKSTKYLSKWITEKNKNIN